MNRASPLVAIVGPTASGKSALAVRLAAELGGEILACDSTQVYRGFDIGTAKPPAGQRGGIPHHMIDIAEPDEVFHAGEYRRRALIVLADLAARAKLPVLTVGTGLYLRALLDGLCDAPGRSEYLRMRLGRRTALSGPGYLRRLLERLDPVAAGRIAPRDTPKLVRAIEVRLLSGKPLSALHRAGQEKLQGYRPVKIGLMPPRQALYASIDRRVRAMLDAGWTREVKELMASGVAEDGKPFQFIGYAELRDHLAGLAGFEETVSRIQQATRRYAKRQITWFRREAGVRWLEGFGDDPGIASSAREIVMAELREAVSAG
ncbi:MAG TPA: tRNA (adenosine(37)-N6)-dimethylallyltransferase MiaA [Patescibacteria group bacterium]|nr:tRNA (adenosine(37)-N6)-dimethylallyltransferase MiaA [Patescibacteria group bacterium]